MHGYQPVLSVDVQYDTVGPPLSEHLCASSIIKVFR